jgi:hypothetical protein
LTYDTYRPVLGAHVKGVAAQWIIARNPRAAMEDTCRYFQEAGRADLARSLRETWRDIEAAANAYTSQPRASVGGSTEEPQTELAPALNKALLAPEAAASILGISQSMVRQHLRARRLSGTRQGGRWFIEPEALAEFRLREKTPVKHTNRRGGS